MSSQVAPETGARRLQAGVVTRTHRSQATEQCFCSMERRGQACVLLYRERVGSCQGPRQQQLESSAPLGNTNMLYCSPSVFVVSTKTPVLLHCTNSNNRTASLALMDLYSTTPPRQCVGPELFRAPMSPFGNRPMRYRGEN